MGDWTHGDPLVGRHGDWSGLARATNPRRQVWVRRRRKRWRDPSWDAWLQGARAAAQLPDGFPVLRLQRHGRRRFLLGELPPGQWTPLWRLRRRATLALPEALRVTAVAAELLAQALQQGLASDAPLERELLADPEQDGVLLCGHWRLAQPDDADASVTRLRRLLTGICGAGPQLDAVLERLRSQRAAGRVHDPASAASFLLAEPAARKAAGMVLLGAWAPRRRRAPQLRLILAGGGVLLVLGAAAAGGWLATRHFDQRLPALRGASEAQARQALQERGYRVRIQRQLSSYPAGRVVSQQPAAHRVWPRGRTVTLVVARAPGMVRVPRVAGLDLGAAGDILTGAGLHWQTRRAATGAPGVVQGSLPPAGSTAPIGSTVMVLVVP